MAQGVTFWQRKLYNNKEYDNMLQQLQLFCEQMQTLKDINEYNRVDDIIKYNLVVDIFQFQV